MSKRLRAPSFARLRRVTNSPKASSCCWAREASSIACHGELCSGRLPHFLFLGFLSRVVLCWPLG